MPYSVKYGIGPVVLDTTDTQIPIIVSDIPFDLEVPLITPGGIPGVLDEPVV